MGIQNSVFEDFSIFVPDQIERRIAPRLRYGKMPVVLRIGENNPLRFVTVT